jgi:hypothetical protein
MGLPRTFRDILDPNGSEAVVKRPGVRGQTGKANLYLRFGVAVERLLCRNFRLRYLKASRVLTLVLIPMARKKFDAVTFARNLINLPPTDVRYVNPIPMPQL